MGTIWTPGGEHDPEAAGGQEAASEDERREAEEALARMRQELRATPAADIVANHAIGLWQLAVIHLGVDGSGADPNLGEAKVAIDALAGILDGAGEGLADHGPVLREALSNLRLAFVQRSGGPAPPDGGGDDDDADDDT